MHLLTKQKPTYSSQGIKRGAEQSTSIPLHSLNRSRCYLIRQYLLFSVFAQVSLSITVSCCRSSERNCIQRLDCMQYEK
ncbi:hypothetical protein BDW60DRAFT_43071 [Aspergillus nidulans var. acristatus]